MDKSRLYILSGILVFIALLLIIFALVPRLLKNDQEQLIIHTAERLGYRPTQKIELVDKCWDVFSHCGIFLYYRTELTREAFSQSIANLSWKVVNQMEVEGLEIFTDINFNTAFRITISGHDSLINQNLMPPFKAWRWRLGAPDGAIWTFSYYPLATQHVLIALNGEALTENIISILYQTK
jgi:hypothetical protein